MRFWRSFSFRDIFYLDKPIMAYLYGGYLPGSAKHADVADIQPG